MASTETFDPKRYTPYEKGMSPSAFLSTFPSIDTAVDTIKLSQGLEKLARVMDRGTLIRTYTAGDLGFILHSRHQYQWHTGYAPPQTVAAPHLGAVIARTLGPLNPVVPAFINIGQRFDVGEGEELKAFTTAGFLGSEYGPFNVPFPEEAADSVRPRRKATAEAGRRRRRPSLRPAWAALNQLLRSRARNGLPSLRANRAAASSARSKPRLQRRGVEVGAQQTRSAEPVKTGRLARPARSSRAAFQPSSPRLMPGTRRAPRAGRPAR